MFSLGFKILKLAFIVLFLIFFIEVLSNIFFFMGFPFESYAIFLCIIIVIFLFIGILPEKKSLYLTFFK